MKTVLRYCLMVTVFLNVYSSLSALGPFPEEEGNRSFAHSPLFKHVNATGKEPEDLHNMGCVNLAYAQSLAKSNADGEKVKKYYKHAKDFFERSGTPQSLCNLGCMHVCGQIAKDLSEDQRNKKACQLFKASGTPAAKVNLQLMKRQGKIPNRKCVIL